MTRQPLSMSASVGETLLLIAEDNDEARHILKRVLTEQHTKLTGLLLDLDDMQMRGAQVVAAFKHCNDDIPTFIQACIDRSAAMVAAVNKAVPTLRAFTNGSEARSARDSAKQHQHGMRYGSGFSRGAKVRR